MTTTSTRRQSGRRFECKNLGNFSRQISRDGCATPGRRFRELPRDMLEALQARPGALLHTPWSFLGTPSSSTRVSTWSCSRMSTSTSLSKGVCEAAYPWRSRRYCKANNRHLSDYNPQEETSYIMLLRREQSLRLGYEPAAPGW